MQVYNLVISEAQRLELVRILGSAALPDDSETKVDRTFLGCLEHLPIAEAEAPGVSHGLCY